MIVEGTRVRVSNPQRYTYGRTGTVERILNTKFMNSETIITIIVKLEDQPYSSIAYGPEDLMALVNVVTPKCIMCGHEGTMAVEEDKLKKWSSGGLIQDVFPNLSPEEREQLLTGTHPACWNSIFDGYDKDDEDTPPNAGSTE